MKVVLFCGGLGLRLRDNGENVPKPMVPIGYRPIIWHLMKYYAHHGHRDFILCLGYKADVIKDYFLRYDECLSNDFVLSHGGGAGGDGAAGGGTMNGRRLKLLNSDIDGWNITFVDTGFDANIGQRLAAVRPYLDGEECFLANYSDNLSDVPLPAVIDHFHKQDKVGCFVSVKPSQSFHVVRVDDDSSVSGIEPAANSDMWINGGFLAFKTKIFDYLKPGEELVLEPFQRLIRDKQLTTYRHTGFWHCMDTFKEKQVLEDLYTRGKAPWEVWKRPVEKVALKG